MQFPRPPRAGTRSGDAGKQRALGEATRGRVEEGMPGVQRSPPKPALVRLCERATAAARGCSRSGGGAASPTVVSAEGARTGDRGEPAQPLATPAEAPVCSLPESAMRPLDEDKVFCEQQQVPEPVQPPRPPEGVEGGGAAAAAAGTFLPPPRGSTASAGGSASSSSPGPVPADLPVACLADGAKAALEAKSPDADRAQEEECRENPRSQEVSDEEFHGFQAEGWGPPERGDSRRAEILFCNEDKLHGHEVWLHVYDLGPVTGRLNEFVLRGANLGAFHCGIEVLGDEWSFQGFHDAWDDPTLSGVVRNEPREHPAYIFRESILLGCSPLTEVAIDYVLDTMMEEWPANTYHLVMRNCVTFAEAFAEALQAPEPFPAWVRGAVDACKAPALEAITDYGWSWFKWWSRRQAEQEALAQAQAEEEAAALEAEAAIAEHRASTSAPRSPCT